MIWFTADYHLGHLFMLRGMVDENGELLPGQRVPRPMFSSVEEMNETIIERHNSVVRPGDLVYNLGDWALKITQKEALSLRRRFIANQYFVSGNHDSIAKSLPGAWVWIKTLETIKPKIDGIPPITLCHYAMRVWNGSHRNNYHLYGHSHGMLPEDPCSLSMDVGVDCHNFYPVSVEQVHARMLEKLPARLEYLEKLKGSRRAE